MNNEEKKEYLQKKYKVIIVYVYRYKRWYYEEYEGGKPCSEYFSTLSALEENLKRRGDRNEKNKK